MCRGYIFLPLPNLFRAVQSIKKSWVFYSIHSSPLSINHIQVPKRFTLNMTPYTDYKGPSEDESADPRLLTEKDLQDRGLTIGSHSKISTLGGMILRYRLCIFSLIAILCLFLSYSKWTTPSVPTKQLEISNPWNVTGYSDENCSDSIFSDSNRGPTSCRNSSTPIDQIDFDGGQIYTLYVYLDANCTEVARTFSKKQFLCANAINSSSYRIDI